MRISIVIAALCIGLSYSARSQDFFIHEMLDYYFPQNPMDTSFSAFFRALKSDTTLRNKITLRRTDTSLFSFNGYYINYKRELRSPKVDIKLGEVVMTDSVSTIDTFFQYQVIYYFVNESKAKIEFENFERHYGLVFSSHQDGRVSTKDQSPGSFRHYFSSLSPISPVTIAWAKIDNQQAMFSIIIRLKLELGDLIVYKPWLKNPKNGNPGPVIKWKG
ncbi:MAG: hypothetical protein QM764_23075 [Chitinophagaceae bacterium]